MRRSTILVLALGLALPLPVLGEHHEGAGHGEGASATAKVTMKGCLRQADGEAFRLEIADAGDPAKLSTVDLDLAGDGAPKAADVAKHVGHQVEIEGTMSGPEKPAAATGEEALHQLSVEKLRHVAGSCS